MSGCHDEDATIAEIIDLYKAAAEIVIILADKAHGMAFIEFSALSLKFPDGGGFALEAGFQGRETRLSKSL